MTRMKATVSSLGCLLALSVGSACADTSEEEARRVELVARIERAVVVVMAEGLEISHPGRQLSLQPSESLGTGIVLSADGRVLTAAHVVADAGTVRVKVDDGEPLPARVVFSDEASDIALLRLEKAPSALVSARLGDSDRVRKGETVFVIGNPVGITRSLSVGVVSGRHTVRHVFGGSVEAEVIQTDAAINSGNSGGPIFNRRGEVIAIAQRILTEGGGSEGLGFGLAINAVKKILGMDPCVWLGFSGVPLDDFSSAVLNVPQSGGVLVERVTPGSPAEAAGIRGGGLPIQIGSGHVLLGGDVVLAVDGTPAAQWMRKPTSPEISGAERHVLKLTLLRAGRVREVPVVVTHRPGW